ncbi:MULTISPECIES: fumarylacetoacetate hydrolase family protein [unclassified Caballeronia]|uniref:fumarylacetoacetate hydrolase family protein n=1 Tax=unclassified Caballeronia TaxID=2646786 RepID=UPI002856DB29|nr:MULTISPECIES: fumarylacetoacetate hydrolase family protein [unclassified Caballeronia]MDR5777326.1 fumarylacetoacetate hydrolase family protein [Caballeronia sp. LZ002]MDR5852742.1 fumarylacetoacetate hydrolase family protein [Caballeronia sp. LZ003]
MKLASFNDFRIGVVSDENIIDVTWRLPSALDTVPEHRMRWLIAHWNDEIRGDIEHTVRRSAGCPIVEVKLLAPVPDPAHVFAAPTNYQKHIGELQERAVTKKGRSARDQGFFLKAPGSVIGAGQVITLPKGSGRRFDHESELAVIIGKHGRNISRKDALQFVFGYSCLMDLTMRIEPGTGEEERSMRKSFASFTPVGPWIVTADEVGDTGGLTNRLYVNDELRQDANTRDLIVGIAELVELVSSVLPVQPGDIIATGTPEGVGPITAGDRVKIAIERVGEMTLPVVEAETVAPRPY